MKKTKRVAFFFALLFFASFCLAGVALAEENTSMVVADHGICLDVVNRTCQDANTSFSSDVGRLCCFTKVLGAQGATTVTHVWYFQDQERARVDLGVHSASWRTYSSKKIQFHEIGDWKVNILGPNGELLKAIEFEITQ